MQPRLTGTCLFSANASALAAFYASVLETRVPAEDGFAVVSTPGAALSIYPVAGMERTAAEWVSGAGSGNLMLEVQVDDLDARYERLAAQGLPIVRPPATQPRGRRSVWLRDPDGNVVNLYQPVAPSAYPAKLVAEYFHRLLVERDLSVCDELLAEDYVDHDAPDGTPPGPQATRAYVADMLASYPNLRFTMDDLVTLNQHVAVRATWRGNHRETGGIFHRTGLVLLRLNEGGQLVERRSAYTDLATPTQ